MNGWILEDDEEEEEEEDPEMEEEMEEENDDDDDAEVINPYEEADPLNLHTDSDTEWYHIPEPPISRVKGLTQQIVDRANTEHSTLKRLSVMDKYLAEFDTDLRSEIKGQHALRRSVCTLEDQVREHYHERPYVAPTAPVASVARTDPDDPSARPTCRPRRNDPYVMVRDAAARNEGDDAATTGNPQPS
ncbi:hypothetical protein Tco_1561892 [Tanacetum coccineum]